MIRDSHEIAAQAMIHGTLGFRASLEVTDHPRTVELSSRLLPWLEQLGVGSRIESFHRTILESPHGELTPEYQTEAFWRGESASILGWSIRLFDAPDMESPIGPGLLVQNLRILQPDAIQLLNSAALRPQNEIVAFCALCMKVRHLNQIQRLPPEAQTTLEKIHQTYMAGLGLEELLVHGDDLRIQAAKLVSTGPELKGLYVVRALAAEWLLGKE